MNMFIVIVLAILFGFMVDLGLFFLEYKYLNHFEAFQYYRIPKGTFILVFIRFGFLLLLGYALSKYFVWGRVIFTTVSIALIFLKINRTGYIKKRDIPNAKDDLKSLLHKGEKELALNHFNKVNFTDYTMSEIIKNEVNLQYLFAFSTFIGAIISYLIFFVL